MKVFVGYGYNERDRWIESDVIPILNAIGLSVVHGKDMYGEVLQDEVRRRIEGSDGLVGFCTLREGQAEAEFNTHPWVRDEMVYALGKVPVIEVREDGVKNPPGIIGDRQRIQFKPDDRLSCVRELVIAVSRWNMRQIRVVTEDTNKEKELREALRKTGFKVRYKTRTGDIDSEFADGRLERVAGGLYMQARGLPSKSLVAVEALLDGQVLFQSDWESVDAVQVMVR